MRLASAGTRGRSRSAVAPAGGCGTGGALPGGRVRHRAGCRPLPLARRCRTVRLGRHRIPGWFKPLIRPSISSRWSGRTGHRSSAAPHVPTRQACPPLLRRPQLPMSWPGTGSAASRRRATVVEIGIGALAGTIPGSQEPVPSTEVVTCLASLGSLVLTFLAGAEIDPVSLRGHWKASMSIGLVSFALPFLVAFGFCGLVLDWHLHAAEIGGVALSTTSVAVGYAAMVETGLNRQDLGKLILAACFITDLGTVLALGGLFAPYGWLRILFAAVTA